MIETGGNKIILRENFGQITLSINEMFANIEHSVSATFSCPKQLETVLVNLKMFKHALEDTEVKIK